ncbi:hypothetical protein BD777DRAFT_123042 [Yarrowia lipolytica]|nr:hypothetical protein BD777DRAFT_123042 [Yarrowia lipolytica]
MYSAGYKSLNNAAYPLGNSDTKTEGVAPTGPAFRTSLALGQDSESSGAAATSDSRQFTCSSSILGVN